MLPESLGQARSSHGHTGRLTTSMGNLPSTYNRGREREKFAYLNFSWAKERQKVVREVEDKETVSSEYGDLREFLQVC